MAFQLRRLGAGDLAAFRALNRLFADAFDDAEHYAGDPPDDAWLEGLLARDEIVAVVAEEDGGMTGGLVAYRLDKFEQRRSELYIYDLAVAARHRRRGIAKALITQLRSIAAEIGAWVIYVQADQGDAPAIALYEGLGAREDVLHFDIAPAPRG